jgi:protein TonB
MKKLLFITLSLLSIVAANAQDKKSKNPIKEKPATSDAAVPGRESVHNSASLEVQPQFPGGLGAFLKFVDSKFDKTKLEPGATGNLKVYVSFVIEADGTLSGYKVLRDPGFGAGAEALRVLKLSPNWEPGVKDGKPVRSSYNLPIVVHL